MLIRYAYDPNGQIFYQHNSNTIPRVGETVIFEGVDYKDCVKKFEFIGGKKVTLNEYFIDDLDSDMFTVTDVCYCIYGEETEIDITVTDYNYGSEIRNDYLENLAKDVNVPNAYR